jgi:hypothetical protein
MADPICSEFGAQRPGSSAGGRFWWLWGAESVSLFGTQITLIALPLVAVQLLDASSTAMGLLSAAGWLPIVIFGLLAGAYVDRRRPVSIMIASNIVRLVLLVLIPFAHAASVLSVPILLAVAFVAGIGAAFFDVAYQTYVPHTVPPERLSAANSRLELSRSVAQLLGPATAGALVTAVTAPNALLIDAASFAIATFLLIPLRRAPQVRVAEPPKNQNVVNSVMEGIGFIRQSTAIRVVVIAAAASNLFTAGAMALQVLLAVQLLDMSPAELGLALTLEGAAALATAGLAPLLTRCIGEQRVVLMSFCLMSAGAALLYLAPICSAPALFAAAQLCFGFSGPLINITLVTIRQRLTPPPLLGRVNAAARVGIMSTMPIGAAGFGTLAAAVGLPNTFLVIAVGLLVVAVAWQVWTGCRAGSAE